MFINMELPLDKNGTQVKIGDTIIDINTDNEMVVEFSIKRELHDCGNVYGVYLPDYFVIKE